MQELYVYITELKFFVHDIFSSLRCAPCRPFSLEEKAVLT